MRAEAQPQPAPWVTASSRQLSETVRPSVPRTSKRPGERSGDSGTQLSTSTTSSSPSAADTQNMVCQSECSMTSAAIGSPTAAPMPSVELISATEDSTRAGGSSSRMMLMPSGTTASAAPCRARPAMSTPICELTAHSTEPSTRTPREASSTRRLPYMSPTLPRTGVQIAPVSRVTVTSQLAVAGVAPVSWGMCGSSGTTRVCMTATTTPQKARTPTSARGWPAPPGAAVSTGSGIAAGMALRRARRNGGQGCTDVHPSG